MKLETLRKNYREDILVFAHQYHIENVRVFGSVVQGMATKNSDIDLLVSLGKEADLLDLGGFCHDVQSLLKTTKVDIIPETSIHWYIKNQVLHEAKPL